MEITPAIIQDFRDAIPAFADVPTWPDDVVEKGLCEGDAETGGSCWGAYDDECHNFKQRGMFYYAAHWLTVMYPQGGDNNQSGSGGGSFGAVSSKTVGDESISYAVNAVDAGSAQAWLSSTGWGTQFLMLKRRAGMGARVV